jgi:hypothetical protein
VRSERAADGLQALFFLLCSMPASSPGLIAS